MLSSFYQCVQLSATPWTPALQTPQSSTFSEVRILGSVMPFHIPGYLPYPGPVNSYNPFSSNDHRFFLHLKWSLHLNGSGLQRIPTRKKHTMIHPVSFIWQELPPKPWFLCAYQLHILSDYCTFLSVPVPCFQWRHNSISFIRSLKWISRVIVSQVRLISLHIP